MVKNEYLRFGGLVDIQAKYKILQFKVAKNVPILQNPPCF
jgi:hypothetical protein